MDKSDISEIATALVKFRDERNWEQFHNSKDLALAIEAAMFVLLIRRPNGSL